MSRLVNNERMFYMYVCMEPIFMYAISIFGETYK